MGQIERRSSSETRSPRTVRQVILVLHRWLGLATGLVVFVVCLTGAILVFPPSLKPPETLYDVQSAVPRPHPTAAALPPSQIIAQVEAALTTRGRKAWVNRIVLPGDSTRFVRLWAGGKVVDVNPYSGAMRPVPKPEAAEAERTQARRKHLGGFFNTVEKLHRELLFGRVGSRIVAISTVIFLVLLLGGLVLWWPRNGPDVRRALTLQRGTGLKRLNYDVHRVLGFYALLLLLLSGFTGLFWSYKWLARAVAQLKGWEVQVVDIKPPRLPQRAGSDVPLAVFDSIYRQVRAEAPAAPLMVTRPRRMVQPLVVTRLPDQADQPKWWFDPRTGARLLPRVRTDTVGLGAWVVKNGYRLHTGAWGGLGSRLLALAACLVGVTLPITGVLIWWPRSRRRGE